jgi:hypothetical protein
MCPGVQQGEETQNAKSSVPCAMEVVREVRTLRNPMWGGAPFYLYLPLQFLDQ